MKKHIKTITEQIKAKKNDAIAMILCATVYLFKNHFRKLIIFILVLAIAITILFVNISWDKVKGLVISKKPIDIIKKFKPKKK